MDPEDYDETDGPQSIPILQRLMLIGIFYQTTTITSNVPLASLAAGSTSTQPHQQEIESAISDTFTTLCSTASPTFSPV